jgi:hypothetical protein
MPLKAESWVFMLIQYNKNNMKLEPMKTGITVLTGRKIVLSKIFITFKNENMKSQRIYLYHKEVVVNKTNGINDLKD